MSRSKYKNVKVISDGYTFDSKAEHRRYQTLMMLEKGGDIFTLIVHPTFELIPPFTDRSGKRHRAITYKADFSYRDKGGNLIVEDVKGAQTAVFKLKHKLLLWRFPSLEFRIVEARHV